MPTNETLKKMGEFASDRNKLTRLLSASFVMGNGNVLWYDGTIEALFRFIDRWIYKEICNDEFCPRWHDGYCFATRDMDPCSCGGDRVKCDYYFPDGYPKRG